VERQHSMAGGTAGGRPLLPLHMKKKPR